MNQTFFFQYNVPADNTLRNQTDYFVDIFSEWNGTSFYSDGSPMVVTVMPIVRHIYDLINVINWQQAASEIEKIVEKHFNSIAHPEWPENNAKDIGAFVVAPTSERYTVNGSKAKWNSIINELRAHTEY